MRFLTVLCVITVLFSCNRVNKPPKPDNLISKDKMVSILVDLTLFNSTKGTNKTALDNNNITIQSYIYERHNVDSIQFKQSNDYYAYDLDEYTSIYSQVEDSLTKLKDVYTEERKNRTEEKRKQDSLKREQKRRMNPKKFDDSVVSKPKKRKISPEVF